MASNEYELYSHPAVFQKNDGRVSITSSKVVFSCPSKDDTVFLWTNINSIKYSPADDPKKRAMVRFQTSQSGLEDVVIQIVKAKDNMAELEKLKAEIADLKKKKESVQNSSDSVVDLTGASSIDAYSCEGNKLALLKANKQLDRQYKDTVRTKLVTDADFWALHAEELDEFISYQSADASKSRGKSNFLIDDVLEIVDGKISINLTAEKKQNLFAIYPAVKRAFEAEVPLKRTEMDFWKAYFQAEYFNTLYRDDASSGQRDDIISRHASQSDNQLVTCSTCLRNNRFLIPIDVEIDLTATENDSLFSHDLTASEGAEAGGMVATSSSSSSSAFNKLAVKYNRNSVLVMSGQRGEDNSSSSGGSGSSGGGGVSTVTCLFCQGRSIITGSSTTSATSTSAAAALSDSLQLRELLRERPEDRPFLTLTTADRREFDASVAAALEQQQQQQQKAQQAAEEAEAAAAAATVMDSSAFGVSTSRKVVKVMHNKDGTASGSGSGGAGAVLTEADRVRKLLKDDFVRRGTHTSSDGEGVLGSLKVNTDTRVAAAATTASTPIDLTGAAEIDNIEQEMLESFNAVTDLLRHFYAILNRKGPTAPQPGNASAIKAEGIVAKLMRENGRVLENKKRKLSELISSSSASSSGGVGKSVDDYQAAAAMVGGTLSLIQRAQVTWKAFNDSHTQ